MGYNTSPRVLSIRASDKDVAYCIRENIMSIMIFYIISTLIIIKSEYNFFKTATGADKAILVLLWPLACIACILMWSIMQIEDGISFLFNKIKGA